MSDGTKITLRCVRLQPDMRNMNNRVYTRAVLEQMAAQVNEKAKNRRMLGRLGQDSWSDKIRISDASHLVLRADVDEAGLFADVEVLDTPQGVELAKLLAADRDNYEVIPCGFGTCQAETRDDKIVHVIQDDYEIITLDIVRKLTDEELKREVDD